MWLTISSIRVYIVNTYMHSLPYNMHYYLLTFSVNSQRYYNLYNNTVQIGKLFINMYYKYFTRTR